jgi:hypothetical protein
MGSRDEHPNIPMPEAENVLTENRQPDTDRRCERFVLWLIASVRDVNPFLIGNAIKPATGHMKKIGTDSKAQSTM